MRTDLANDLLQLTAEHLVLVIAEGEQGLGRVRRQFLRIVQSAFGCVTPSAHNAVNQRLRA